MRKKEIMQMKQIELKTKLEEIRKELIKINAQVATGTNPKNPGQIRELKKNIARILTAIRMGLKKKENG